MATNFKLKRSSVANKRPGLTNLELGELALNTYDGYLFAERNGLGITTVTNLTPWFENYGAASVVYTNSVGIGTTTPISVGYNSEFEKLIINPITFSSSDVETNRIDIQDHGFITGDKVLYDGSATGLSTAVSYTHLTLPTKSTV